MSETEKDPDTLKADALVEEGLKLYSQGQLDQSLSRWQAALEEVPDHPRAKDYIKYVEDNRSALEESFRLAATSGGKPEAPDGADAADPADAPAASEVTAAADAAGAADAPDAMDGTEGTAGPTGRGGAAARDQLLADPPPGQPWRPEVRIESTARMDVEELRARLNATKLRTKPHQMQQREEGEQGREAPVPARQRVRSDPGVHQRRTPSTLSPAVGQIDADDERRDRKATPLVLVAGEGQPEQEGFEPLENTPLGVGMPEPARLVGVRPPGFAQDERTPVMDLAEGLPAGAAVPGGKLPSSTQTALGAPDEGERVESMLAGARQLLEQGTNEGSLWLCERVLTLDPDNADAKHLLVDNRKVLLQQYQEQIGELEGIPVVQIPQHEIMWHKLDHRAGFLLSRIDGQLTYGDIIDVSGMGEFEATRILAQLQAMGVIGARK